MVEGEKKIGRPTKMTPEVLKALRQAFLVGATKEEASHYAGISKVTLYTYIENNPEFLNDIEAWTSEPILKAKTTLAKSLSEPLHAKWYLERRAKKDYGANVDVTTDGDKLSPILVKFIGESDEPRQDN